MIRHGSCNANEFVSHSANFSRLGNLLNRQNVVDVGYGSDSSDEQLSPKMASQRMPDVAIWDYNLPEIFPTIYVITLDDAKPHYVWEADSRPEPGNDVFNPMVSKDARGNDLLSGGTQAQVYMPSQANLETFEPFVEAKDTPSWVTNTRYADLNTDILLRFIFRDLCRSSGIKMYERISDALNRFHDYRVANLYKLNWLRAASMIHEDHQGISPIPLFLNHLTVDITNSPASSSLA